MLEIIASKRIGDECFTTAIRKGLLEHYKEAPVGLGGVFLMESGKATFHIMSPLSTCPLNTGDDVNKWLNFIDFSSTMICLSYIITRDPVS